jgi:hypothetical protein
MQSESFWLTMGGLTMGLAAALPPAGTRPPGDRIAAAIQEQPSGAAREVDLLHGHRSSAYRFERVITGVEVDRFR